MAEPSAAVAENSAPRVEAREWPIKLFKKSPLKQKKLEMITSLIGDVDGKICLDIGSDNGVISFFLRERGGEWYSADLIAETVDSIRALVGERVHQIDGRTTPYNDNQFDVVIIVDFLEHIESDSEFIEELYRVLKPGGTLVVNVPNPRQGVMRWLKSRLGQTDEAHGHVRPGYSTDALRELLGHKFTIQSSASYSRLFSDLVDTGITFALDLLKKGGRSKKGTVVTGDDLGRLKKSFTLYSILYPFVSLFVRLDSLFPFLHGNMLIARCDSTKADG